MGVLAPPRSLQRDDTRKDFDCGEVILNHWFRRYAWRNEASNASRTYVVMEQETGNIAGYVSLATGQIEREFLIKAHQRNTPNPLPVLLLGQLAVAVEFQGKGLGVDLLQYAFRTALAVSQKIGMMGIIAHPINKKARQFYERFGFSRCISSTLSNEVMFIRIKDLEASAV